MNLEEIDKQLKLLQIERQKYLNEDLANKIRELSWTKNVDAALNICPFGAAGLPKYEITLYGVDLPYYSGTVCIMGDNAGYEKCITYGPSLNRSVPSFYTSCPDILFEFLNKVTFKSFVYDTKTLDFLTTIKNIVDSKYVC
jgi:hypothetical protein